jgi:hypothetical protein
MEPRARRVRSSSPSPGPTEPVDRFVRVVLVLVIIQLAVTTASIHLGLGGQLFTLNGLGYLALAFGYGVGALVPLPIVQRFAWLPRFGLAGYTLVTISAYVVIGPHFALGWITKGIETALVGLLVADVIAVYGSPSGVWGAVLGTPTVARPPVARPPGGPRHA